MVFEVSAAKRDVLKKLAERDWTPTDLAAEIGKSRNTVYNHLDDLHKRGLLTTRRVAAKTRPKTEYSIGAGIVEYVAVLPGQYAEKRFELTPEKEAIIRIWNIPQEAFHPYVERYWWHLKHGVVLDYRTDVEAIAVYGSVARGDADDGSDVDVLVITADERAAEVVTNNFGSYRIETDHGAKLAMTEAYSLEDYRASLARGSDFLEAVRDDCHVIYDPDRVLEHPGDHRDEQ